MFQVLAVVLPILRDTPGGAVAGAIADEVGSRLRDAAAEKAADRERDMADAYADGFADLVDRAGVGSGGARYTSRVRFDRPYRTD